MKARQNLNMTEGQLYHPKNAAKLFLAFLCEKSRRGRSCNPEKFFPLMKNLNKFARFYNGTAWRRINPHYTRNLKKYYRDSKRVLGGRKAKRKSPVRARKSRTKRKPSTKRPEARSDLKSICKKVNGSKCTLNAKRFDTNKRLLNKADASRVPGAEALKKHYCERIKYLLEGQRSGRFMRPRRNWNKIYRSRKKYVNKKCGK